MKDVLLLLVIMLGASAALVHIVEAAGVHGEVVLTAMVPWALISVVSAVQLLGRSCFNCGVKKSCPSCDPDRRKRSARDVLP